MKKINIILIILLSLLNTNFCTTQIDIGKITVPTMMTSGSTEKYVQFLKKNALVISTIPIIFYHYQDIINFITYRPYISSFCFYLTINYLCDLISSYQEQKELYAMINSLKKISFYLVISHGIKNHIHQKNLKFNPQFTEQDFLHEITEKLTYSLDEITFMSLKLYQELKNSLNSLNSQLKIESEEFVFLCYASSINIHTILYLAQNEPILYKSIYEFEKNPQHHILSLIYYLKEEITESCLDLEKQLIKSNIRFSIKL